MSWFIVGLAGIFIIQDGAASIWYYRKTENGANHIWRVIRICWGVLLVVLAFINI